MELNKEQIIKALECCLEDVANCNNCPYERYCAMHENNMLRDALSLIKELTDENERLYQSCTNLERDTVCKMHKRLKKKAITIQDWKGKIGLVVLADTIDQIAEESIDENND